MTKSHAWRFFADGARPPASAIRFRSSSDTGSGSYCRTLRRARIASQVSNSPLPRVYRRASSAGVMVTVSTDHVAVRHRLNATEHRAAVSGLRTAFFADSRSVSLAGKYTFRFQEVTRC